MASGELGVWMAGGLVAHGRGAEVVPQPQRVADLVHRHILQIGSDEGLGLGAGRIQPFAHRQHVEEA